jgi:YHS domain-containing protein
MKSLLLCSSLLLFALAGCATVPPTAEANAGPTDICYVCRYNNDLACVNLHVKDTTPRAEYNGKTYYFCSDGCRTDFLKKPEKYLRNK